ncbi:hypothetical protein T265_15887, partial [Opisthorchis viverrini]
EPGKCSFTGSADDRNILTQWVCEIAANGQSFLTPNEMKTSTALELPETRISIDNAEKMQ